MSSNPSTLRVHRLLAASHPEPIDRADLPRRLGLPIRVVDKALRYCVQTGVVRQVRSLKARNGYAYTVTT